MINNFLKTCLSAHAMLGDFLIFSNDLKNDIDDKSNKPNEFIEYFLSSGQYICLGLLALIFLVVSIKYIQQIKKEKNTNFFKDLE